MHSTFFRSVSILTLIAYLLPAASALAAPSGSSVDSIVSKIKGLENSLPEMQAAEYVLRRYPGEKLMPVRILGGVNRPGVYYLPEGTDLLTAISLSAGLDGDSDSEKIHWNKGGSAERKIFEMDELMKEPKKVNPVLTANDMIFVERKEPVLSTNTMLLLTAISSVVGIAIGAVALSKTK